jgi:hypothetical protein
VLSACFAGCYEPPPGSELSESVAALSKSPSPPPIHDDLPFEIARQIGSFAGYYCKYGDLHVGVTGQASAHDRAELQALVEAAGVARLCYRRDVGFRAPQVVLVPKQYDFLTLQAWRDGFTDEFFAQPEAQAIGISYSENRVRLVTELGSSAVPKTRALALSRGLPNDGFFILEERRAVPTTACPNPSSGPNLEACFRPVPGGVRIDAKANGGSGPPLAPCTLTVAGSRSINDIWVPGYLTASHCVPPMFSNANDWVTQEKWPDPPYENARVIGVETHDPPGWWCWWNQTCRHSDAAWISDTAGMREVGTIVQTQYWNGSKTQSSTNPRFHIWGGVTATEGMEVEMMGATNGWRMGHVEDPCESRTVEGGYKILCSVKTTILAARGDSGAPVFYWWWFYGGDTVEIVGSQFSSNLEPGTSARSWASSWVRIQMDLGTLYARYPYF